MITRAYFDQLIQFPRTELDLAKSPRWEGLCHELYRHEHPRQRLFLPLGRKWELVSAMQKAIRRGDRAQALQLIAMIESMPSERAYFWRRLSVVACEDIGAGDPLLTTFVIACSKVFTPVKARDALPSVYSFLVEKMCAVANRSRTACSLAGIAAGAAPQDESVTDRLIRKAISERITALEHPDSKWRFWQRTNDWRGGTLLRFLDLTLPFDLEKVETRIPAPQMLHGLPSDCYDMYTRIGRSVLRRLILGVEGAEEIQLFFQEARIADPITTAGEALFFAEGGRVHGEILCRPVLNLRHKVFASRFGLTDTQWARFRRCVEEVVEFGLIDRLRIDELNHCYAQQNMFGDRWSP